MANVFMKSSSFTSSLSTIHPPNQYFEAEERPGSSQPLETDDVMLMESSKLNGSMKKTDEEKDCPNFR